MTMTRWFRSHTPIPSLLQIAATAHIEPAFAFPLQAQDVATSHRPPPDVTPTHVPAAAPACACPEHPTAPESPASARTIFHARVPEISRCFLAKRSQRHPAVFARVKHPGVATLFRRE